MKILIKPLIINLISFSSYLLLLNEYAIANSDIQTSPARQCGKVLYLSGDVLLLDHQRKEYKEIKIGTSVDCGDWISTGKQGKVVVDFKPYGKMIIGLNTFFQSVDLNEQSLKTNAKLTDQFVLFRGDVYIEGNSKTTEASMITPNSRIFLKNGKSIVSFLEDSQSTQVISLEGSLKYKNRFLDHTPWVVEKGSISKITDGEERLLPSQQAIIEANSLDLKLKELEVESKLRKSIVEFVTELSKKKSVVKLGSPSSFIASDLKNSSDSNPVRASHKNSREIASVKENIDEIVSIKADDESELNSSKSSGRSIASVTQKLKSASKKHSPEVSQFKNSLKKKNTKNEAKSEEVNSHENLLSELSQIKESED